LGGIAGAWITGSFANSTSLGVETTKAASALGLERLKFETGLVIKAIDTVDQQKAVQTLSFFAKAGLIPNFAEKVIKLSEENEGSGIPTIGERRRPPSYEPATMAMAESKKDDKISPYIAKYISYVAAFSL
jgi:hypothetical protein